MRSIFTLLWMMALAFSGVALVPDRAAATVRADGKCLAEEQALDGAWAEYNRISFGTGIHLTNPEKLFAYYSNPIFSGQYQELKDLEVEQADDAKGYLKEYGDNIEKRYIIKRSSLTICYLDFLTRQAAAGGGSAAASGENGGMRGADSATGGAVGQNRGKGGNPDWMYDDADHGQCVSVEGVPATGGSGLAYGHYKLINSCAYPLEIRTCITPDRLDGSDSNYDLHRDGAKCPGMGWGAGTIGADEVQNGREWFEYNRLKWDIQVCRKGWDFIGEDDRYPSDILGEHYGCRTRRANK